MKKYVLLILAVVVVAIPVILWAETLRGGQSWVVYTLSAGQVLGLVGLVLLLFQIILSSKVRLFEAGVGYDRLMGVHRLLGITAYALLLFHPITLTVYDIAEFGFIRLSLPKFAGVLGFIALTVTAALAVFYKRWGLRYETWKYVHKANYAIFVLVTLHSFLMGTTLTEVPALRGYWIGLTAVFGVIVLYKVVKYLLIRSRPYTVAEVRQESHDTHTLRFSGPKVRHLPGQFMFVQLVRNGKTSESHPFTISSSPEADQLAISPKSVGDFTNSVGEIPVGAKAIIDAPYGVFSFRRYDNPRLVFVAGGIGITPFMSMFRSMRDTDTEREVLLIWGNKTEKDILFADELEEIRQSVGTFDIVHVMSHQEDFEGEKGYITEEILRKYVQEFSGKEYFVCGPPVMMNLVDGVLQRVGVTNRRIHMERFAL